MRLANKVAVITGAGSGIGSASARVFAREGARVAVADMNDAGGKETVDAIRADGGEAIFIHTDVSKAPEVKNLVKATMEKFGRIDVFFNNAGTVEGNSIEGSIEAQLIKKPTFSWKASLVVDRSRNEITEFEPSCFTTQTIAYRCKGTSLHDMYGFQFVRDPAQLPEGVQASANQFVKNDEILQRIQEKAASERELFEAQIYFDSGDLKKAVTTAYEAMVHAAQGLVKVQSQDVPNDEEIILSEFKQRYCDTQLFYDKYAGGKFAEYLFKARDDLRSAGEVEKELALQRLQEAQLFIDATHSCYNKLSSMMPANRPAGNGGASAGEG